MARSGEVKSGRSSAYIIIIIIIINIYSESYPAGISLHNILISIVNAKEQC